MTIELEQIGIYILTFARVASMISFNSLFGRKNVSSYVRSGLILLLTILIAPNVQFEDFQFSYDIVFVLMLLNQVLIGFCLNFIFQIFYYMLFFVGDFLDMQFGLSAAKIFDPNTNIQMSLTGNFLNLLFVLYIFVTNSHLTLIKVFADSFKYIPFDTFIFNPKMFEFILNIYTSVFTLGLKLILPFLAVEFILEISMGILMRLIPQIHIFVINIQIKLLVAILLLIIFSVPMAEFIDKYIVIMFDNMTRVLFI
ncbi:MAG: flagellar biosynthetic protein FliR [Oscillospiraceae bacterium]